MCFDESDGRRDDTVVQLQRCLGPVIVGPCFGHENLDAGAPIGLHCF